MSRIKEFLRSKWFRFSINTAILVLFTIWIGRYWLLPGIAIIYDIYISRKINWTPWKKREGKNHFLIEWFDALLFAVVAVTLINTFLFQNYKIPTGSMEKSLLIGDHLYVSKVAYGPRIPNTPLSFPFVQHTMPFSTTKKSFITWPNWPYERLAGLSNVNRGDAIVFNFPAGDTVITEMSTASYYSYIREVANDFKIQDLREGKKILSDNEYKVRGRKLLWDKYNIVVRPVDKRDNYVKRCVAIPGDELHIKDGIIFINGEQKDNIEGLQYYYTIRTNGNTINPKAFERLGISKDDRGDHVNNTYIIPLTAVNADKISKFANILSVERHISSVGEWNNRLFPHSPNYRWSLDQYGPLKMPSKGETISVNIDNLPLYERIIDVYEDNNLEIKDSIIYINGKQSTEYTFKMDYYFMMGDNRHASSDGRYWGFVPEDHVVGKPKFIWLSLDKDKSFPANIRWSRMFTTIK